MAQVQRNQQDNQKHGEPVGQINGDRGPCSKLLLRKQRLLSGLTDINCRLVVKGDDNENIKAVYQQMLTL